MKLTENKCLAILGIMIALAMCPLNLTVMASTRQVQNARSRTSSPKTDLFDYAVIEANRLRDVYAREHTLAYIATKCAEAQQFERALAIASKLSVEVMQAEASSKIAIALWKADRVQDSQLLIERIKKLHYARDKSHPNPVGQGIFQSLINAYSETEQYAKAIEAAEAAANEYDRDAAIRTILGYYLTSGRGEISEKWLNSLLDREKNFTSKSLQTEVNATSNPQERQWREKALRDSKIEALREMTWFVCRVYAKKGDFKRAEELAHQVGAETDEEGVWHAASKESGLGAVAVLYAEKGRAEDAFRVMTSLAGETKVRVFLEVARVFIFQGKQELALQALAPVIKPITELDPFGRLAFAYASAAVLYKELGQDEKCEKLLRQSIELTRKLSNPSQVASNMASIAVRCAEAGELELLAEMLEAERVLIINNYARVSILGAIAHAAAKNKQYAIADKYLLELVKPTDQHNGFQKVRSLMAIAEGFLEAGDKERATQPLREAVAFQKANPGNTRPEDLWRFTVTLARAEQLSLLVALVGSIKTPDRQYFANALADLGVEFARFGWKLDARQKTTWERLIASSN